MPGMPGYIAKGTILRKIDAWVNDTPGKTPAEMARQALKKLVPNKKLLDVIENDFVPPISLTGPEHKHLEEDWFDITKGWWKSHQPIEHLVRQGLRQACLRIDQAGGSGKPIDIYWACAGQIFELWALESREQVTVVIATPPPGGFILRGLTHAEPIWVTRSYLEPGDQIDGEGQNANGAITVRTYNQP